MPLFDRYVGIDYSGAETAESTLKGLRVYVATPAEPPREEPPPPSPRKYWTRRGLAEWLCAKLAEPTPTLVGIDHGFSFPVAYFNKYGLPWDWNAFLDDFQRHWPTDEQFTYVDSIRDGISGKGSLRTGKPDWFRLTEQWTATAKSVFQFDIQGSVAKSTHSGMPECVRSDMPYVRLSSRPLKLSPHSRVRVGKSAEFDRASENPVFSTREMGLLSPGLQALLGDSD